MFCPNCGSPVATSQPSPAPSPGLGGPKQPRTSVAPAVLAGVAVGVVIVLLGGILLLLRDSPSPQPTAGVASPSTSRAETASPTSQEASPTKRPRPQRVKTVTATPAPGPGDVRTLPAGWFCRDLNAQGYSYVAAVDYWRMHGQPNQMDADRNGIPCETVYPASDISAYWGGRSLPNLSSTGGLFCRDLAGRGFTYPEAVAYWWLEGMPDRMDADLNGIPCETVYPASAVYSFWYR